MTRLEWETELKKCMRDLPSAEQERVLEYYNELFADGMECGKSEKQLVGEFGNPVDVAYRIMAEYGMDERGSKERRPESEDRHIDRPPEPKVKEKEVPPDFWKGRTPKAKQQVSGGNAGGGKAKEKPEKRPVMQRSERSAFGKIVGFVAEIVLVGWLPLTIAIVAAALLLSVIVVGVSLAAGSVWAIIASLMPGLTAGVRIVGFAAALVAAGGALLILPNTWAILKALAKSTVGVFKGFFGWVVK